LRKFRIGIFVFAILGVLFLGLFKPNQLPVLAQQPTGAIATVTGTVEGPMIRVDPSLQKILVYAGPSSFDYPAIGVLLGNEVVPALAMAEDQNDWIEIYYPGVPGSVGWVYALYMLDLRAVLPRIPAPFTPTPFSTPTINPTLESAFIGQQTATRLPTFTPPPPLDVPAFRDEANQGRGIPTGLLILGLGLFGFLGAVISYLRGR
jgi:hypothetical protein